MRLNFLKSASIALDLGNNNTLLTDHTNKFLSQPSFIVLNKDNKATRAVGRDAYEMLGRTSEEYKVIKPLKGGVIADYDAASKMLKMLIKSAHPQQSLFGGFDQLVCGIPYSTTEVEKRALRDALEQFRTRNTSLIYEPIAAAIGMGLDVQEPDGKLIVDIGGGITEVALVCLSGIVSYRSLEIAGDTFDMEIQDYCKKQYNIAIGIRQAESLKLRAGAAMVLKTDVPEPAEVIGKDFATGIPRNIKIGHEEIAEILNESIKKIEDALLQTLDECPPELSGDVYDNGIYLTGGNSLLRGLKERLENRIKIPFHQDENALYSVSRGISKVLKSKDSYKAVLFK